VSEPTDPEAATDERARLLGLNHVALAVGDVDAAVSWYRDLLAVDLRGRTETAAFLDAGDQFVALAEAPEAVADDGERHVGLVVDDPDAVERRAAAMGAERPATSGLDVLDPWGNRLQFVGYAEVQFTKADHVLDGMGVDEATRTKTAAALAELRAKGMAPEGG